MKTRLRLAFALATLLLGLTAVWASDRIYSGSDSFPDAVLIDPATGLPYSAAPVAPLASGTGGISGVTLGTTATQVLPVAGTPPRRALFFYNENPPGGPTVSVCPGGVTPASYAPGCFTLQPGGGHVAYPANGYVPQDAWFAIASAANTMLTIEAH